jgi:molecular chaperone GrpE
MIWQRVIETLQSGRHLAATRIVHPLLGAAAVRLARMAGMRVTRSPDESPAEWKRQAIENFQSWLADLPEAPPDFEKIDPTAYDLYTLLVEFTALRQEIRYQNREQHTAIKAQQDFMTGQHEMTALFQKRFEGLDRLEENIRQACEKRTASFFFDIRDALRRGLAASRRVASAGGFFRRPPGGIDGIVEGYELALRRFDRALSHLDIEPVETVGRLFDPALMAAVDRRSSPGAGDNEVLEEVAGGFTRHGTVLRIAKVIVNKAPSRPPTITNDH